MAGKYIYLVHFNTYDKFTSPLLNQTNNTFSITLGAFTSLQAALDSARAYVQSEEAILFEPDSELRVPETIYDHTIETLLKVVKLTSQNEDGSSKSYIIEELTLIRYTVNETAYYLRTPL